MALPLLSILISTDFSGVESLIKRLTRQLQDPDLRDAADVMVKDFKRVLRAGRFTPLKTSTKLIRAKRGRSGGRPLTETGRLLRSIRTLKTAKASVEVGSDLRKSGLLRFGGTTSGASAIGGKIVAERNWMKVEVKLLNNAAQKILDQLE